MVKLLVFVTLLAIAASISAHGPMNEEQRSRMMEIKQQCADELKLSPADINKMKSGDTINLNPSHKCFAKCIFDKTGVMVNGKLNEAAAVDKISMFAGPEQAANVFNQCKNVGGADPCEIALRFFECTNKNKH